MQFFILYKSAHHLDYKHTVFGRVVGGKPLPWLPVSSTNRMFHQQHVHVGIQAVWLSSDLSTSCCSKANGTLCKCRV